MKEYNKYKKCVEPKACIATTISTVVTAIFCTVASAIGNQVLLVISVGMFLVAISAVFLQIFIAVSICNEKIDNIGVDDNGIIFPQYSYLAQSKLDELLHNNALDISTIKIICYGTSGYGNLIKDLCADRYSRSIELYVVVCSDNVIYQSSKSDMSKIREIVQEASKCKSIHFNYAKFLPTIRGCIVYNSRNEAIWSCLQTYNYRKGRAALDTAEYTDFYSIVGDKNNSQILNANVNIIEREYQRLIGD